MRHLIGAGLLAVASASACAGDIGDSLQARDLTGDGIADAYYSVSQGITWLADANYAWTSGFVTVPGNLTLDPGGMTDAGAHAFVDQLDFGGIAGWRLPMLDATSAGINSCLSQVSHGSIYCATTTVPNELATLLQGILGGNVAGSPFINYSASSPYWFGQEFFPFGPNAGSWTTMYLDGTVQMQRDHAFGWRAWAVHDGDVGVAVSAVPEPATFVLMAAGLAAVGVVRRRRRGS